MANPWWHDPNAARMAPLSRDWVFVRRELDPGPSPLSVPAFFLPPAAEFYPPYYNSLHPSRPTWPAPAT